MKLEEVNTRTKEAVDFLVAALESGHSEVLTALPRSDGEVSHLQLRTIQYFSNTEFAS